MKSIKITENQLKRIRTQLTDQLKDVLGKVEFIQGFLEMLGGTSEAPKKRGRPAKKTVAKTTAKRKPGRPAKAATSKAAAAKKATPAKKRGRPAKSTSAAAKKAAAATTAPKKRGRKPAAKAKPAVKAKPQKRGRKKIKPTERNSKWGGFILNTLKQNRSLYTTNKLIEQAITEHKLDAKEAKKVKTAISASLFRLMNVNKKVAAYKVPGRKGKYYGLTSWFDGQDIKKMYRGRLIH